MRVWQASRDTMRSGSHTCSTGKHTMRRERVRADRYADTPPGLKPHGFSVHPRSLRHGSPKALPAPLDILRRVLISIEDEAAGRADVRANGKALVHPFTAA